MEESQEKKMKLEATTLKHLSFCRKYNNDVFYQRCNFWFYQRFMFLSMSLI